jgi:ABC-type cobalamin/Fe3+-siderophores transport system ATPase subunit
MKVVMTLKNYRCFVQPASFEIEPGFTAFLGQNNAGKSTAMRFLYEFRPMFRALAEEPARLNNAINTAFGVSVDGTVDPDEVFSNLNRDGLVCRFDLQDDSSTPEAPRSLTIHVQRNLSINVKIETAAGRFEAVPGDPSALVSPSRLMQRGVFAEIAEVRSLLKSLSECLYIGPFRNAINVGSNDSYMDIAVGETFIRQFRAFKTGPRKAHNLAISDVIEDIRRVFGFESLNVEPTEDNRSLHITVNGKPYKQHELGSGLIQFVLVLANVAVRTPPYVLIDEPELNLHPALQLDFLTTIGKYTKQGVMFSTHSIGLARSAAERIYVVHRRQDGDSVVSLLEAQLRLGEFLGEMSFSAHKELGFEKILLVEGPTDVTTMQVFLRKMGKDHEVVLLPLSGRITGGMAQELDEVKRISPDVFALIDSEKSSVDEALSSERQAFVDLCARLGIQCHVLEKRATENYFSSQAIAAVLGRDYEALTEYERMGDRAKKWPKGLNWKLANEMSRAEIGATDLGAFLQGI